MTQVSTILGATMSGPSVSSYWRLFQGARSIDTNRQSLKRSSKTSTWRRSAKGCSRYQVASQLTSMFVLTMDMMIPRMMTTVQRRILSSTRHSKQYTTASSTTRGATSRSAISTSYAVTMISWTWSAKCLMRTQESASVHKTSLSTHSWPKIE